MQLTLAKYSEMAIEKKPVTPGMQYFGETKFESGSAS